MALTPKQKIFADEYLIDLNATRAYKVAYSKVKKDEAARANGSRLLTNANVADYIEKRMKEREKRTKITQDMVLQELAKLGFFDIRKLFDDSGKPLDIASLDNETAALPAWKSWMFMRGLERIRSLLDISKNTNCPISLRHWSSWGVIWGCSKTRWSCQVAWIPKRPNWMTFLSRCVVVGNECGEIAAVG